MCTDQSWKVLNYIAEQFTIDFECRDTCGFKIAEYLMQELNTKNEKHAFLRCKKRCPSLYNAWNITTI